MKRTQTLIIQPFQPAAGATGQPVPILIPRGDRATVITQPQDLWQMHYREALENGNNHAAAERFANLIVR